VACLAGCGHGDAARESRALDYVLHGSVDLESPRAFIPVGRSLAVLIKYGNPTPAWVDNVLKGSDLVADSSTGDAESMSLAHGNVHRHLENLLSKKAVPSWFKLPDSGEILEIRRRQDFGKVVCYITAKDGTLWIYGSSDRW
jgi:hypothetical protein